MTDPLKVRERLVSIEIIETLVAELGGAYALINLVQQGIADPTEASAVAGIGRLVLSITEDLDKLTVPA